MSYPQRPRQPKLRQSCDGCFLAKVKCSKQRPICNRCLSVGLECRYSPSTRQGKSGKSPADHLATSTHHELTVCLPDPHMAMYAAAAQQHQTGMYHIDPGWSSPPPPAEGNYGQQQQQQQQQQQMNPMVDMYQHQTTTTAIPWLSPHGDMTAAAFAPYPLSPMPSPHDQSRSPSFDMGSSDSGAPPPPPWQTDQPPLVTAETLAYTAATAQFMPSTTGRSGGSTAFQSAAGKRASRGGSAAAGSSSSSHHHSGASRDRRRSRTSTCTCFNLCLQSLQALHDASSAPSPALETALSLNRRAVEGCKAVLACEICMRRGGTRSPAMLLGTVIGKVAELYRSVGAGGCGGGDGGVVSGSRDDDNNNDDCGNDDDSLGLSFETSPIEISRELASLEEVYASFRDVCKDFDTRPYGGGDAAAMPLVVEQAMVGYLGQNLGDTVESLGGLTRREDLGF